MSVPVRRNHPPRVSSRSSARGHTRPQQVAALTATAAIGLAALIGCSSSAGTPNANATGSGRPAASATTAAAQNVGLSDSALLAAFKKATDGATAVHVKGRMKDGADTVTLDLQLNKAANTAQGTVEEQGATIPIISVGGVDYLQLTDSVIKMVGADSLASMLRDKWVSSASTIGKGMNSGFWPLVSYDGFFSGMTSADPGGLTSSLASGTTTYAGQIVAVYRGDNGTDAYFAANGPAYLLAIVDSSSTAGGSLAFTWNQPTTVTAPPASQIFTQ